MLELNQIPRRIYYDKTSGLPIYETGEQLSPFEPRTIEQDFEVIEELKSYNRDMVGVLELEWGRYSEDFSVCNGFRVNLTTMDIEFSYPNPNEPEAPHEFRPSLSGEIEELKQRQDATENAVLDLLLMGGM